MESPERDRWSKNYINTSVLRSPLRRHPVTTYILSLSYSSITPKSYVKSGENLPSSPIQDYHGNFITNYWPWRDE